MMKTIKNDVVAAFDVDQTLVMWGPEIGSHQSDLSIRNPYDGLEVDVQIHAAHVRLLKQMKARGRFIIVWSAGGAEWAQSVVNALNLQHMVDLVMTKPIAYVDDMPVESWMQHRIYIPREQT
jgi:protein-L-isoaspartate O-methyltransferase